MTIPRQSVPIYVRGWNMVKHYVRGKKTDYDERQRHLRSAGDIRMSVLRSGICG
jgi:hypothetical protein